MLARAIVFCLVWFLLTPAHAQGVGGADGGYKLAYDAFCAGGEPQYMNIMHLAKLKQITDDAFINARFDALKRCPSPGSGLPWGTIDAVYKLKDVKRVFHIPDDVGYLDPVTGARQFGGTRLIHYDHNLLSWFLTKRPSDVKNIRTIVTGGADVNWRNQLGYPLIYFAARSTNPEVFKLLVDAGAKLDIQIPRIPYQRHQPVELTYADVLDSKLYVTPTGRFTGAEVKPDLANGGIWNTIQTRGHTKHLLSYVVETCTEFRSPNCWANLNVMFDKGMRPPANFLHAFFQTGTFNLFFDYPEYSSGVDRLLKMGVSINAPDAEGKTVLAKLMTMRVNPKTLEALIARGAQMQATAPKVETTASLPPSPSPVPKGVRNVTASFNVRELPTTSSPLHIVAKPGQKVEITGSNSEGTWSMVSFPDLLTGGWVLNSALLKNSQP